MRRLNTDTPHLSRRLQRQSQQPEAGRTPSADVFHSSGGVSTRERVLLPRRCAETRRGRALDRGILIEVFVVLEQAP